MTTRTQICSPLQQQRKQPVRVELVQHTIVSYLSRLRSRPKCGSLYSEREQTISHLCLYDRAVTALQLTVNQSRRTTTPLLRGAGRLHRDRHMPMRKVIFMIL